VWLRLDLATAPHTACTPAKYAGAEQPDPRASTGVMMVGRFAVRVFKQFSWLEAGSGKAALSRPAHQRVPTPAGRCAGVLRNPTRGR